MKRLGLEFNPWYLPLVAFIVIRGAVEFGWWYAPVILVVGLVLAIAVSAATRRRKADRTPAPR